MPGPAHRCHKRHESLRVSLSCSWGPGRRQLLMLGSSEASGVEGAGELPLLVFHLHADGVVLPQAPALRVGVGRGFHLVQHRTSHFRAETRDCLRVRVHLLRLTVCLFN